MSHAEIHDASMPSRVSTPAIGGLLQRKCACGRGAGMTGDCEACSRKKRFALQTKLAVSTPGDRYEEEADRIADQVTAPSITSIARDLPPRIQRLSADPGSIGAAPASVDETLSRAGAPLEPAFRQDMERRFGHDFSRVRVHSGAAAEQSTAELNAKAYTVGHHIVFGANLFAPQTPAGRHLLAHELTHVVQQGSGSAPVARTSGVFGTVQRQVATKPVAGQAAQKKSRLVRIERYWRSPSARAFFDDGSNEEVTFVAASSLEPTSQPEGASEKVVDLTIDRSFPIRPHVEFATHSSGSKVKVVTRLSPADRISKLPASVRRELWEAFLSDPANESDPQMMEFIADMGEGLKETSSTTKIEEEGRDPVKLARMQAVDQWVGEQQSDLDKVGTRHRARFTQLLSDVRKVGVTGPVEAEDLGVQDIELVLAGAAGGQSEFQTFNEFKRVMEWKLRSGNNSLPEENADNPDLYIRNEYRKAWKAEAAGLRNMSRIAEAAQVAPFKLLAYSAAVGTGFAALEVAGAGLLRWAAGRGISHRLLVKWAGTSLLASSAVSHFVSARDEAKAAGMDPNSPSGIVNTGSVALLRTFGVGEVKENIENQSMLTGQPLNRSAFERITGGVLGAASAWGAFGTFVPEAPSVVPAPRGETPPPVTANEPPSPQEIKFPRVDVTEGKAFDVPLNPPTVPRQLEFPRVDVTQGKAFDVPLNPPAAPRQLEFPRIDVTQGKAFHAPEPPPQIAFPRVDVTHGQAFHAPEAPKSVKSLSEEIATLEKQRAQVGADAKKAWDEARPAKNKVKRNEPVSAQEQELIKKHDDLMAARDKLDAELTKKRAQRTQQSPRFRSKEHREVWVGREKQAEQVLKNIAGEGNVYVKPMIARPGTAKLPLETTPGSFSVRERTRLGLSANQVSPEFGVRLNDGSVVMVDMKGAGKHSWTKQKFIYEGLQRDGRGVVVVGRPGLPAGTVVEGKVVLLGPAELDELVASPTLETLMRLLGRSK